MEQKGEQKGGVERLRGEVFFFFLPKTATIVIKGNLKTSVSSIN